MGIHNIFCLTGDHPRYGDHAHAQPVFELDSFSWLSLARKMRDEAVFDSGRPLIAPPRLFLGAAAAPDSPPVDERPAHAARKVAAGADFLQTQPIFDVPAFTRYMACLRDLGVTEKAFVIAGIAAMPSVELAEYLHTVPDIRVPDALIRRLRSVPESERDAEGLRFARDVIEQVREIEGVRGVLIYPLDLPNERMVRLIEMAGVQPPSEVDKPDS